MLLNKTAELGPLKTVLFVCTHNAGRSQMAETFFNDLATERGSGWKAESAGTVPGEKVNPVAAEAMAEIGHPMDDHCPKLMTQEMVNRAAEVITMGCGVDATACPAKFILSDDWGLEDPAGQGLEMVRKVRDEVRARVEVLLNRLESQ